MESMASYWSVLSIVIPLILYAFAVYGFICFFWKPKSRLAYEPAHWTPLEAVGITLLAYFGVQFVIQPILFIFVSIFGLSAVERAIDTPHVQFIFTVIASALMTFVIVKFAKRRETPLQVIGVVGPKLRDIGWALLGFVTYFVGYVLIAQYVITTYLPQIDTEQKQQLGFDSATTGPMLIFVFLSLVIIPPLIEELMVRGFLYTGLRQRMHKIWAAIVASLIFGAAHLEWGSDAPLLWIAAIDTFVLSLVLIWIRQKTGSLWPSIGVHFIKNGIAFLALFIFKVT